MAVREALFRFRRRSESATFFRRARTAALPIQRMGQGTALRRAQSHESRAETGSDCPVADTDRDLVHMQQADAEENGDGYIVAGSRHRDFPADVQSDGLRGNL